ncbi:hypothetical protein ES705_45910 [subsurface metagenome]
MSSSSKKTLPAVTLSKPDTQRNNVVLPQPEGPSNTTNSPGLISKFISLTAFTLSKYFFKPLSLTLTNLILPLFLSSEIVKPIKIYLSEIPHMVTRCFLTKKIKTIAGTAIINPAVNL